MKSKQHYKPLSPIQARLLLEYIVTEIQNKKSGLLDIVLESELPFLSRIVKKRVDTLNLPVTLTRLGLLAVECFCISPGDAVALLVDFLTEFEGQDLTVAKLTELYPWGFYNEKEFSKYVVNVLKLRKSKWAHIY